MPSPNRAGSYAVTMGIVLGVVLGVVISKVMDGPAPAVAGGSDENGKRQFTAQAETFRSAAATIAPSVVAITTMKKVPVVEGYTVEQKRDIFGFQHYYRRPKLKEGWSIAGIGSGFVLDAEKGLILTNNHVVQDGEGWVVRLGDKRELNAELVGRDSQTDIAVLKVDPKDLAPAKLGDSDKIEVGDWVLAAGNPFGLLEQTITSGIVSAKGRRGLGISNYEDFIQTDAAINQGNSGGPLVNLNGEVVGVNTAIYSRTGGYQGIGFAIPINQARKVAEKLIAYGKVQRGWLGVKLETIPERLAQKVGVAGGMLVRGVFLNGPAHQSGLQPDDIIVQANGHPVAGADDFREHVADLIPGSDVKFEIQRLTRQGYTRKEVSVKLGEQPENPPEE